MHWRKYDTGRSHSTYPQRWKCLLPLFARSNVKGDVMECWWCDVMSQNQSCCSFFSKYLLSMFRLLFAFFFLIPLFSFYYWTIFYTLLIVHEFLCPCTKSQKPSHQSQSNDKRIILGGVQKRISFPLPLHFEQSTLSLPIYLSISKNWVCLGVSDVMSVQ